MKAAGTVDKDFASIFIAVLVAEDLRELANRPETERVPLNRQMFTHTPPIPGFNQQSSMKKRKRGQSGRG